MSTKNWCDSEVCIHKVKFDWTINNFDFHEGKGKDLISSTFTSATNDKFKWCLICKPNGVTEKKDEISLLLRLTGDEHQKVFGKFTLSACGQKWKSNVHDFSTVKTRGWDKYLAKDGLFRFQLSISCRKLKIHCNLKFSEMENFDTNFHQCENKFLTCSLSKDLEILFERKEFSDVLISVNGKDIPAHKNILAVRSPVFATMLRNKTLEAADQSRLVIDGFNEDVVNEMLRFIYTEKCQNLSKVAVGLLAAADKFALNRLKIICTETLSNTLSVENAVNILVLADLHGVQYLKTKVIKFIGSKFAQVMNTSAWKDVMVSNPQLANEVCQAFASRRFSGFLSKRK